MFDDIVLLLAMKPQAEIGSRRELHILKRRKIVPGSVLLKYFRNIACGDLYALFPNVRVVMSTFDKAFLGVSAIAGGIPILLNSTRDAQSLALCGVRANSYSSRCLRQQSRCERDLPLAEYAARLSAHHQKEALVNFGLEPAANIANK